MNYKGLETLDGTLKNKDDTNNIKRIPLQRRQSLLAPGRSPIVQKKNTKSLIKIKKSKF